MFGISVKVFTPIFIAVLVSRPATAAPVRWFGVALPAATVVSAEVLVHLRVRNDTAGLLENEGPRRTWVSAVIVDGTGSPSPAKPVRVRLNHPLPPGGTASLPALRLRAPSLPGRYVVLVGLVTLEGGRAVPVKGEALQAPFEVAQKQGPTLSGGPLPGDLAPQAERRLMEPERRS